MTKTMTKLRGFVALLLGLLTLPALAQLTIEITGAGANRIPVAIAEFDGENRLPKGVTDVVRSDLERSGLFKLVLTPTRSARPPQWMPRTGKRAAPTRWSSAAVKAAGDRFEVRFRLHDTLKAAQLGGLACR